MKTFRLEYKYPDIEDSFCRDFIHEEAMVAFIRERHVVVEEIAVVEWEIVHINYDWSKY